jgi:hypothetical protein
VTREPSGFFELTPAAKITVDFAGELFDKGADPHCFDESQDVAYADVVDHVDCSSGL